MKNRLEIVINIKHPKVKEFWILHKKKNTNKISIACWMYLNIIKEFPTCPFSISHVLILFPEIQKLH